MDNFYFFVVVVIVQLLSCIQLFATPWTSACQAPLSSTSSQSLLKFMSINQWCHPTISSSATTFSFLLPSFPASGSFPMSQLFTSVAQSIRVSPSVLPVNIQGWFPLLFTGLILQSKGLSRVFSNITVQKLQFFSAQSSLGSSSHICTWLLEKP